jgi:peroxiredoxin
MRLPWGETAIWFVKEQNILFLLLICIYFVGVIIMKRLFLLGLLLLIGISWAKPFQSKLLPYSGSAVVGKVLPSFGRYEIRDAEQLITTGRILKKMAGIENARLVVVFFSTDCLPCREGLQELRDNPKDSRFVVLVSVQDDPEVLKKYLQTMALPFSTILDEDGEISRLFGIFVKSDGKEVAQVPLTAVADSEGKVLRIITAEGKDYLGVLSK